MRGVLGRIPRSAIVLTLAVLAAWGLRITLLEGFVYEWPRGFAGDFHAVMFTSGWWDGTGIMYGPVFVFERWLVNAWPRVFTIHLFALTNVPVVALAFVLSLGAARANGTTALAAFTAWCCFRWLFYAFSVAANPELLEMLFLTIAWYAASRAKAGAAWAAVGIAALTKVIPVIFAPLLLLRASRRAVVIGAATAVVIVAIAGAGQGLSPRETVLAILVPSQSTDEGTLSQVSHIVPTPSMGQHVGLNTALARAMGMTDVDPRLPRVQTIATVVTALVCLWSAFVAYGVLRGRHTLPEVTRLALSYGLFFALMPLATLHTHPHTFVFLLPAWTALIATLAGDANRPRATAFGAAFLVLYVCGGVPSVGAMIDRLGRSHVVASLVFADPIWANLGVVLVLSSYALRRTRDMPLLTASLAAGGVIGGIVTNTP